MSTVLLQKSEDGIKIARKLYWSIQYPVRLRLLIDDAFVKSGDQGSGQDSRSMFFQTHRQVSIPFVSSFRSLN